MTKQEVKERDFENASKITQQSSFFEDPFLRFIWKFYWRLVCLLGDEHSLDQDTCPVFSWIQSLFYPNYEISMKSRNEK